MTRHVTAVEDLVQGILSGPSGPRRRLVALAGAPASGKSTLSADLADLLTRAGEPSAVVPMDGFHLDNRVLERHGLLARKGAPETFDLGGLTRLVGALRTESEVVFALFDRSRDLAVAGAAELGSDCTTAIVEGNYLLLDEPGWRDLAALWDVSVRLDVPRPILRARLIERWRAYGLSEADATERAEGNDLRNADRIADAALPADITYSV